MEDKIRKIQEGMDVLLSLQRKFQVEHGFDFWKESPDKKRDMFIRTLFAAIDELGEAGDEVNRWWKHDRKEPEALDRRHDKIVEEMIDALHFYLGALLILGVDGKELADVYINKNKINFERQKNKHLGYI